MEKLKPCPFCGGNLEFVRNEYTNKYGKRVVLQYWLHDDTDCILNGVCMPFTLGAGDADIETGYVGEYAEKWNRRVNDDRKN